MYKVVVIGGGWAGCAAAVSARKAGADVIVIEKTDLLLGLGNVGGIMRNNGRYTACEENIALGGDELFEITDRMSRHVGIDFPGHRHASVYDVIKIEPEVRRLLHEKNIEMRFEARAVDCSISGEEGKKHLESIKLAGGEIIDGDIFIECTGSSGPMGNCTRYGNGCSMCILRCPAFGPRVSITEKAGLHDITGMRTDGSLGAFSGSGKLLKESLSDDIRRKLDEEGVAIIPLPAELIKKEKLSIKVCQQYALDEFAENIILIDTGHAKIMTPFFPVEKLRTVKGFENARYLDPYAGGKGNSIRYLSTAERDDRMCVRGTDNMLCAGEKAGLFVGHTEAICTGSLAGHNAVRILAGRDKLMLPETLAIGDMISYVNKKAGTREGLMTRYTFAGADYFERMKSSGLYTTDKDEIEKRVSKCGLKNIYKEKLI